MVESKSKAPAEFEMLIRNLGTPSAQQIFGLLSCWDFLPIKEIVNKTRLSESQVHFTLSRLEKARLLGKKSRGVYEIGLSQFSIMLKNAYRTRIEQMVGTEMYSISKVIDVAPLEEIKQRWAQLVEQWDPIIRQSFSYEANSIAGHIMDMILEKGARNN